jgi:hypothetical protein
MEAKAIEDQEYPHSSNSPLECPLTTRSIIPEFEISAPAMALQQFSRIIIISLVGER